MRMRRTRLPPSAHASAFAPAALRYPTTCHAVSGCHMSLSLQALPAPALTWVLPAILPMQPSISLLPAWMPLPAHDLLPSFMPLFAMAPLPLPHYLPPLSATTYHWARLNTYNMGEKTGACLSSTPVYVSL